MGLDYHAGAPRGRRQTPSLPEGGASDRGGYGAFMLTVTTFFLAEMGDKTQIAAMALAARFRSLAVVIAGTTCGMMLVEVPTVLLAGRVTRIMPLRWIRLAAALAYGVLGVLTLLGFAPLGF